MTREENSISLFTERREESSSHARISTNEERNTLLLPILSRANDSSTPKISNFFYTIMLSLPISFISNEYITRIMGQARLCLPRLFCPFFPPLSPPLSLSLSSSRLYRNEEDFGRVENRWNNIYRDWPWAFEQFAVSEASGG